MNNGMQLKRSQLSMAGEFGVCSELNKREFLCSVTYGNAKAMDIIVLSKENPSKYAIVEVKTTCTNKFVTNYFQKYYDSKVKHPDFWIFVHINHDLQSKYYIFTHKEVCDLQMQVNKMTQVEQIKGCDNLPLRILSDGLNKWEKLIF